jgi:hypothetical protein
MEALVRTTLNIDEALLADYKQLAARSHRSLSAVIQDALREQLARYADRTSRPRVKLPTFGSGGVLPGVDLNDNAALAAILEEERDAELVRRLRGDAE